MSSSTKPRFEPVIVVEERAEIERGLQRFGVPFEGTFAASLEDARRVRADLARFVRADLKTADRKRAAKLRRILSSAGAYVWHCAGFERGGSRYLLCSFVRYRDGNDQLTQPRFPEIHDGGTDVGRSVFSLKAGQIVTLSWNADT